MLTAHCWLTSNDALPSYTGCGKPHEQTRRISWRARHAVWPTHGNAGRMADGVCAEFAASYAQDEDFFAPTNALQ